MTSGALTCKAVVDWVELEIRLAGRSNFWTVQTALRAALRLADDVVPYVEPLDEGDGGAASVFRFRIQDPKQISHVARVLADLREQFQITSVQVVGIEVAFDTYCQGGTVRQLAEIAADRFRFLTTAPGDDWYFYRYKGEGRRYVATLDNRRDLVRCFEEQWQLTDRQDKSAGVRYHAYVKTRDAEGRLKPYQHRARLEVTLQGSALPCTTLQALKTYNFATLAGYFKFRRLDDDLHPAAKYVATVWSKEQLGRRGKYRRPNRRQIGRYAGTSVFKGSTVADDSLNAVVYECLRKLTRNWRSKRVAADFPEGLERQTRMNAETAV